MSELKAVHAFDVYEACTKTGDDDAAQVYLKSEADKVIAELKHQRDGAFGLTNSGLALEDLSQMAKKEIDRQKYKRCLAMAMWCAAECVVNQNTYKSLLTRKSEFRIGHFRKWYLRWLAIAEKFKDAK